LTDIIDPAEHFCSYFRTCRTWYHSVWPDSFQKRKLLYCPTR